MLSKNQIKYINSLQIKKFRQIHQSFITEGAKSVEELLASDYVVELVAGTEAFLQEYASLLALPHLQVVEASAEELSRLGSFQTNNTCIAIAKTKQNSFLAAGEGEFVLVLDDIRDPGNLGTILRIADWYGFPKIICSETTTDFYNPKVIAASKGSFTRVQVYYTDLAGYFSQLDSPAIIGTFLEGESLHRFQVPATGGYLVMGNESNGIGAAVAGHVTHRVTIPRFGKAESLNAGIATALVCDTICRQVK